MPWSNFDQSKIVAGSVVDATIHLNMADSLDFVGDLHRDGVNIDTLSDNTELLWDIGFGVRRTNAISWSNDTEATYGFNSEDWDSGTFYSSGTVSQFVIPSAGVYQINAGVIWDANATNSRDIRIEALAGGGTTVIGYNHTRGAAGGSRTTPLSASTQWYISANGTLQVRLWQNSGAGLNVNSGYLRVWKIGVAI